MTKPSLKILSGVIVLCVFIYTGVPFEIENSIILENTSIRNVGRIEGSLVGKEVEISGTSDQPKAHKLMLGDHSKVVISK
jgi:NDP-sugar pyrophosphorylase family protein